jgi:hypothetical protein
MSLNYHKILCFFLAISAILLICLGCSSSHDQLVTPDNGGSGTQTIGILVDPNGNRLAAAKVTAIATSSGTMLPDSQTVETTVVTNDTGLYSFPRLDKGSYNIQAISKDSLYTGLIAFTRVDTTFLDLGTDTLHGPGAIKGRALIGGSNMLGTWVFIPGTSYLAITDSLGNFTISWVPLGRYDVYYQHDNYETAVVLNVQVFPEETTLVQTKTLQYDPNAIPPAPANLAAVYDTLHAVVHLYWENVTVSDIKNYTVKRDSANAGLQTIMASVSSSPAIDTISFKADDSLPISLRYQVIAKDTLNMESNPSLPAIITAVPPSYVTTRFEWALPQDSLSIADSFSIILSFSNPTRKNKTLSWYVGNSGIMVRRIQFSALSGSDTLAYLASFIGSLPVRIAMLDEGGTTWQDSMSVTIGDSASLRPRNTWQACSSMAVARRFASAATIGSQIYTVGGCADLFAGSRYIPSALKAVERYDVSTGQWTRKADLRNARYAFGLAAIGGSLYAIGGSSFSQDVLTIELYDTTVNSWTIIDTMPSSRQGFATCVLNGMIYCFGGIMRDSLGSYISNAIDVYDPSTGNWTARDTMLAPRSYHQVVAFNGSVYILGGLGGSSSLTDAQSLSGVEKYDPVTGRITPTANMLYQRLNFSAAEANGAIIVAGGFQSTETNTVLDKVDSFDPVTGQWQARQVMSGARQATGATVYDNIMYVIGGAMAGPPQMGELKTVVKYYP